MEESLVNSPFEFQSSLSAASDSSDDLSLCELFQNNEEKGNIKDMNEYKIIKVCYKIFLALHKTKVLDKYLSWYKIPPTKQPTLRNYSPLCCYLYKIKHSSKCFVPSNVYSKAIDEIALIFHKKVENLWENLRSEVKSNYEYAVKKNRDYFEAKHLQHGISKDQNKQKNLFRLNILSLFFKTNKDLMKLIKASKKKSIIRKSTISAFFKMNDNEHNKYLSRYMSFTCELVYDYVEQFQEFIILACLMDLKYLIGNFISKNTQLKQIPQPPYPVQFKGINALFENRQDGDEFKYLFSQLVFSTNGEDFSKRSLILKSKVLKEINEITLLSNYVEKKELFLHIKVTNNISLDSLHIVYRSILAQNCLRKQDKPQDQLKHDLQNIEWIHAKGKKFPERLKKIVFHTQTFKLMYDNHVVFTLMSKSIERRNKLQEQILPCLLKIGAGLKRKQIFASLHQISYQDAKYPSYVHFKSTSASQKKTKSKKYQIVILSTSKKILACTIMQDLDANDLYGIIYNYFKKKSIHGVSLILLERLFQSMN